MKVFTNRLPHIDHMKHCILSRRQATSLKSNLSMKDVYHTLNDFYTYLISISRDVITEELPDFVKLDLTLKQLNSLIWSSITVAVIFHLGQDGLLVGFVKVIKNLFLKSKGGDVLLKAAEVKNWDGVWNTSIETYRSACIVTENWGHIPCHKLGSWISVGTAFV